MDRRYFSSEQTFDQKRCLEWFRSYANPQDPDMMGPDGIVKFCNDVGLEPENVVMLVLAYKMRATQMGFFTRFEWLKGLTELECDSIPKMQSKLYFLKNQLKDPNIFHSVYRFAYDFAKDNNQRNLEMRTAKSLLNVLLGEYWALYPQFSQFLDQSKYKGINRDQWSNILEFCKTIHLDLSNYDSYGAWPVMLDEFVEWLHIHREADSQLRFL